MQPQSLHWLAVGAIPRARSQPLFSLTALTPPLLHPPIPSLTQLPLAVRYLKDTLQLQFPEIASRAAAEEAERAAHAERQRQQLRRQLGRLLGGGEWREGAAGARQLLLEVDECFAILDEQQAAAAADAAAPQGAEQQQQGQQGQQQQEVPGDAGMEWEDVPAAGGDAGPALDGAPGEGLAAYGAAGDAAEAAAAAEGRRAGTQGGAEAELAVVRETLAGLYRQLANRVLPQLQVGLRRRYFWCMRRWVLTPAGCQLPAMLHLPGCACVPLTPAAALYPCPQERLSVLARAESEGPAQEAERQRTLRAGTELRGRLAAAKARCDAMALDLDALLLRRQRLEAAQAAGAGGGERPRRGGENGQQAAAVAAAMQDLFGDSSEEDEEEGSRQDGGPQNTATGPAARGQQQQRRGQRPGRPPRRREEDDFVSPYMRIVDPAAPRPRLPHHQQQQQQQSESKTKPPPRQQPASSLPEDVRKRLAEQVRCDCWPSPAERFPF